MTEFYVDDNIEETFNLSTSRLQGVESDRLG